MGGVCWPDIDQATTGLRCRVVAAGGYVLNPANVMAPVSGVGLSDVVVWFRQHIAAPNVFWVLSKPVGCRRVGLGVDAQRMDQLGDAVSSRTRQAVAAMAICLNVGAFFVGRAYGQHPLAINVSPGKTREGAAGGMCLALIICVGALVYSGGMGLYAAIGLTITMSVVSIFGDLFESLLKRVSGVKDSGDILPGHGGVLDRIDSIVAVLPFLVWSIV